MGPPMRRLAALASQLSSPPPPLPRRRRVPAAADEPTPTAEQRAHYDQMGYVVIDGLVPPALLTRLLGACDRLTDLARDPDACPEWMAATGRTTQGEPTTDDIAIDLTRPNPQGRHHTQGEPWHVAGIYHPEAEASCFLEYLGLPSIMDTAQRFLGGQEMQLGDAAPFVNPTESDFSIGWHRDAQWYGAGGGANGPSGSGDRLADFSEPTERAKWEMRTYDRSPDADIRGRMTEDDDRRINASNRTPEGRGRIKWHMPLLPDETFGIVPRSHLRWRTAEERAVLGHYNGDPDCLNPAASSTRLSKHSELANGVQIALKPGQCLYWNGDCIHRGANKANIKRRTLACNAEIWDPTVTVAAVRARGGTLFQRPDAVWRCQPEVRAAMPNARMLAMYDRWLQTQPYAADNGLLQ